MRYDPEMVKPMREELTRLGVQDLLSAEDVDGFLSDKSGTSLIVVNSVCGCAAGMARPGIRLALRHAKKPGRVGTVFAGVDVDAVARARHYFGDIPPSSPSIALFKEGELVHFVPRHQIEGRDAKAVALGLMNAFDEHCGAAEGA